MIKQNICHTDLPEFCCVAIAVYCVLRVKRSGFESYGHWVPISVCLHLSIDWTVLHWLVTT